MQLTLLTESQITHLALPENINGCHWLRIKNSNNQWEKLICIEGVIQKWIMSSNPNIMIYDEEEHTFIKEIVLEPLKFYSVRFWTDMIGLIYTEPVTEDRKKYKKYIISKGNTLKIGRSADNDIVFQNPYVSSFHARLEIHNDKLVLNDQQSSNGTYVNGQRIVHKELEIGDVIYILGLKIIIGNEFISLNNPDNKVVIRNRNLSPYSRINIEDEQNDKDSIIVDEVFYRSPRFKRDVNNERIRIDLPPQSQNQQPMPLALTLGPSLTMGMASLSMGTFTVVNAVVNDTTWLQAAPSVVMSSSMLLGTLMWPILTKQYEKKQKLKREQLRQNKYTEYLINKRSEMNEICQIQQEILCENYISIDECIDLINTRKRNLWEKTPRHNDYLHVRLGTGMRTMFAEFEFPEKRFSLDDDNLQEDMYHLVSEPKLLENVPITYSLLEEYVSGIIGNHEIVFPFVRGIILQLAALHSYDEVKMIFLYDEKDFNLWNFVRWLPHTWNNQKTFRYIASNHDELKELSVFLERVISDRIGDRNVEGGLYEPYYIIFASSMELLLKLESLNTLMKSDKNHGISVITINDNIHNLPKDCSIVIELENGKGKLYDKDDVTGNKQEFCPDICIGDEIINFTKQLANIQLDISKQSFKFPDMITFLELFQVGKIEQLNPLLRWYENNPTLTLQTPIGVDARGDIFYLDLHEKYHGPHGLVAGMTGSGKSEFIITYILSMAVNYHPNEVAFILIDYKGGGLTGAFENDKVKLPHLAGTITNLDGASIKRSLISIQSELRRRQAEFNEARRLSNEGTMDIYKYQKLFREGIVKTPMPHLFIISDEFAELKAQQPEFMEQLISAARIGRSLGVHLILATQKPAGVVDDQIWSNSRFRVCLKVQEKADSMDMIKRPDAAELSNTGRFYLQVGFNEFFDIGQSAWCGAPYIPCERLEKKVDNSVQIIDNLGRVVKQAKPKVTSISNSKLKQIVAITDYLSKLAYEAKVSVRPLWLDAIAPIIDLEYLKSKYGRTDDNDDMTLNPIIGELDDPFNQSQRLITVPFSNEGNALVYGISGSGKTTFITTMLYHLLQSHSPKTLQMYILDFEAETLRAFSKAPHVGEVLLSSDGEKIDNLWKMLYKEISVRKKKFSDYGGDMYHYNKTTQDIVPNILIVINNYSAYAESYPDTEESIIYLAREGTKYGIYFLLSVSTPTGVRLRLQQNFKQIFLLQLNDKSEYSALIGTTEGVYPSKYKGRGIIKVEHTYEFQTAYVTKKTESVFDIVMNFCKVLKDKYDISAKRIPILPENVSYEFLHDSVEDFTTVPIGVEKKSLNIIKYDFTSYINMTLAEDKALLQDYTTGLVNILKVTTNKKENNAQIIVLDSNNMLSEDELINGVQYYSKELETQVREMFQNLVTRNNAHHDSAKEELDLSQFPRNVYIITSMKYLLEQLTDDGKDKLRVLLEKGEKSYRVNIIILEEVSQVVTYSSTAWYRKHVNGSTGVWLGNGFSNQYVLKVNKTSNDLYQEIGDKFGYVLEKGRYVLVKTLSSRQKEREE